MLLDGHKILGVAVLNNVGEAMLNVPGLSPGSHSINAIYSGDGQNAPWGSGLTPLQVNSTTTTSLASSVASTAAGSSLTLTARVKGAGSSAPPGTVAFMNGATMLGTAKVSSSGVAVLSINSLPVGNYTVTAAYSGAANYFASTSVGVTVKISK